MPGPGDTDDSSLQAEEINQGDAADTSAEISLSALLTRPAEPNAILRHNITSYGLTGSRIDPKMPLRLSATLCVTQYETGEALAFQTLLDTSKPMKLEDWAAIGKEGLEAETRSLVHRISEAAQAVMGRQVRLNYKTTCGRRSVFEHLVQPLS